MSVSDELLTKSCHEVAEEIIEELHLALQDVDLASVQLDSSAVHRRDDNREMGLANGNAGEDAEEADLVQVTTESSVVGDGDDSKIVALANDSVSEDAEEADLVQVSMESSVVGDVDDSKIAPVANDSVSEDAEEADLVQVFTGISVVGDGDDNKIVALANDSVSELCGLEETSLVNISVESSLPGDDDNNRTAELSMDSANETLDESDLVNASMDSSVEGDAGDKIADLPHDGGDEALDESDVVNISMDSSIGDEAEGKVADLQGGNCGEAADTSLAASEGTAPVIGPSPGLALSRPRRTIIPPRRPGYIVKRVERHTGSICAEEVLQYRWPPGRGGRLTLLQEQVSMYLDIKSFKRRYPELTRRQVGKEEMDYLKHRNAATVTQMALGLTALECEEVFEIMSNEFPDKYAAFQKSLAERQKQEMANQQNEYRSIKTDTVKLAEMRRKAMLAAADWNTETNQQRKRERRCFFDLTTMVIQGPRAENESRKRVQTNYGSYPVAVLPGQYQNYYKPLSPEDLKLLPVNTVLDSDEFVPKKSCLELADEVIEEGLEDTDLGNICTGSPIVGDGDDSGAGDLAPGDRGEDTGEHCAFCQRDVYTNDRYVQCAKCFSCAHPSCIEMGIPMYEIVKQYAWECMECKPCSVCSSLDQEDKMLFCDRCDRGYHTFCVGLEELPSGSWRCPMYCDGQGRVCHRRQATPQQQPPQRPTTPTPSTSTLPAVATVSPQMAVPRQSTMVPAIPRSVVFQVPDRALPQASQPAPVAVASPSPAAIIVPPEPAPQVSQTALLPGSPQQQVVTGPSPAAYSQPSTGPSTPGSGRGSGASTPRRGSGGGTPKSVFRHRGPKDPSNEPPFRCEDCDREFSSKWNLQRHLTQQHEVPSPPRVRNIQRSMCKECGVKLKPANRAAGKSGVKNMSICITCAGQE